MIDRKAHQEVSRLLEEFPAVALLGPRQIGKTTLAQEIAEGSAKKSVYLDLESPSDVAKLTEPEAYFELYKDAFIILDEIQRAPELFTVLRGVIDRRRRAGFRVGQFLILGSASLDLLQQSSETLAGRIAYKELPGINVLEIDSQLTGSVENLWLRGGFPDSLLAKDDGASIRWRNNFITTYLERDIPQLGPRVPAVILRRLWTMLAHNQACIVNMAQLGSNLGFAAPTVKRYVELLEDLLLIRTLKPWSGNIGKRLIRSPKIYIRDSGLTHALLNLTTLEDVLAHPVVGNSWEGFVIENLVNCLPDGVTAWFYRTAGGAEIDLVIERKAKHIYAIEIKRSLAPTVSKGFHQGCEDINANYRYVVYPGRERFPLGENITAIPIMEMMQELLAI